MKKPVIILTAFFIFSSMVLSQTAFEIFREGVELHKSGDYGDAIELYDSALELDPQLKFAWSNKGYAYQSLGEYDTALVCYYRALEIDSGFADAWYNKACLHSLLGEKPKMIYSLRKAIKFKPELKSYAKNDPDFEDFRDDPDFQELTGDE